MRFVLLDYFVLLDLLHSFVALHVALRKVGNSVVSLRVTVLLGSIWPCLEYSVMWFVWFALVRFLKVGVVW